MDLPPTVTMAFTLRKECYFSKRTFSSWNQTRDRGNGIQKDSFRSYFPDFWDILLQDRSEREHRQHYPDVYVPESYLMSYKGFEKVLNSREYKARYFGSNRTSRPCLFGRPSHIVRFANGGILMIPLLLTSLGFVRHSCTTDKPVSDPTGSHMGSDWDQVWDQVNLDYKEPFLC
jgi:hypothetical protein